MSFSAWCAEKRIQTPLEPMKIGQLDQNLRRFYAEARSKKGEDYSRSTLPRFSHSIERYLNAPPFSRGLPISTDPRFARSNLMLDAQIKKLKRSGKENVSHKPAIEEEDLQKPKSSEVLSLLSPLSLLRNVWFHVVLYFCRRGLEGQRSLTTNRFKFETDAAVRSCISGQGFIVVTCSKHFTRFSYSLFLVKTISLWLHLVVAGIRKTLKMTLCWMKILKSWVCFLEAAGPTVFFYKLECQMI